MSGIGDKHNRIELGELNNLLSAIDAEVKEVVKVYEKQKEVLEAEKKKEIIGCSLIDSAIKRAVDEKDSSEGVGFESEEESNAKKRRGRGPAREKGDVELKLFARELKERD